MFDDDEREFIRRKKLFEPMMNSEAWKEYEKILKAQIDSHWQVLLKFPEMSADGLSQVMQTEYRKGAVFGIQRAIMTPYDTIKAANEILSNRQVTGDSNVTEQRNVDADLNELPDGARVTELGGSESE